MVKLKIYKQYLFLSTGMSTEYVQLILLYTKNEEKYRFIKDEFGYKTYAFLLFTGSPQKQEIFQWREGPEFWIDVACFTQRIHSAYFLIIIKFIFE